MNAPIKVIGYCRVSTTAQANLNDSCSAQMLAIEAMCQDRGYELVGVEDDRGVSGVLPYDERPALSRAISRIDHGEANALAFQRLDRLSRNAEQTLSLFAWAHRRGANLLSVVEHIDTTTAWGRYMLQMMAAQAELQRALLGESVKESMASIRRSNYCVSRFAPFGYRLGSESGPWEMPARERDAEGRKVGAARRMVLVANEQEMQVRDFVLGMLGQGRSHLDVLEALRRTKTPYPRGGQWTSATLKTIIKTIASGYGT